MIMHLPLDIVALVAYELLDDPWCLSRLCQTSSAIYQAVVPIIYGNVNLPTCKSIEHFCRTINRPACQFGGHTRVLKVADYTEFSRGHFTTALANEFRTTLESLPNLQELVLGVGFAQFDLCFNGLEVPFSLRKLRVPAISSKAFRSFISGQGSITELHLARGNFSDELDVQEFFRTRPDVLPRLNSVTARFPALPSVVFGRPVTEVIILSEGPSYSWLTADESSWKAIYCTSAAPITSVGYYLRHDPNAVNPWNQMILALRANMMHMYLRGFRIEEVFGDYHSNRQRHSSLTDSVQKLIQLTDFDQLEFIDITLTSPRRPSKSQIIEWLEGTSTVAIWQGYFPLLERVNICGVELE